jgi:hypothetical protein
MDEIQEKNANRDFHCLCPSWAYLFTVPPETHLQYNQRSKDMRSAHTTLDTRFRFLSACSPSAQSQCWSDSAGCLAPVMLL